MFIHRDFLHLNFKLLKIILKLMEKYFFLNESKPLIFMNNHPDFLDNYLNEYIIKNG